MRFAATHEGCLPLMDNGHYQMALLQDEKRMTELMILQENMKLYPFGAVWEEYCRQCGVAADDAWFADVKKYETEVLLKR